MTPPPKPDLIPITFTLYLTQDELESLGQLQDRITPRPPSLEALTAICWWWFGGTQGLHWDPESFRQEHRP